LKLLSWRAVACLPQLPSRLATSVRMS
jgi:hypothetical protein